MAEAIVYLHEELNMLHADCHADNFMIKNTGEIVLSDFGTARVVGKGGEMHKDLPRNPSGRCFKPLGCAPEHTLD
jgi:serine/threonine protein kinase